MQHRGPGALRVARVRLVRGDDRALAEHQLQEVPLLRLARRGALGEQRLVVGAGGLSSGLGARGLVHGAVGLGWEGARWFPMVELSVAGGDETHGGLTTRDLLVQVSGVVLATLRFEGLALRLGPAAGVGYVWQSPEGRPASGSFAASLGARAVVELRVSQAVGVQASGDLRGLVVKMADGGGVGVVGLGTVGVGLSIAL